MGGNLILVAGYPKSGSTWVRLMFEALTRSLESRVAINELGNGFYGGYRRLLVDAIAPISSSDLLPDEIDDLLPHIFRQLALESRGTILVKVHDVALRTKSGQWLYPPEQVRSVIYLVRHPFDVAVSLAHHLALDMETAVSVMNQDHVMAPAGARMVMPFHERIGSWSGNIESWIGETPYRVTLCRYEDFHTDPVPTLARAVSAAGWATDTQTLMRALECVRFERLESEEQEHGFGERPKSSPKFFRAGKSGSWRGVLDESLRNRIVQDHGTTMRRLGYHPDGETGDPAQ